MVTLAISMVTYVRAFFIPRHQLALEAAALRQQLAVFKRKQTHPRLHHLDRCFWAALRRVYSGWAEVLIIVKPETVVSWHRAGFRWFWRWRSKQRRPGRPKVSGEIRQLIRHMKAENPTWGAPRIHGELRQLGFTVAEPTVSRYLQQLKRHPDQGKAKQWLAFLNNHREVIAAFDFFIVPSLTFRTLYCFFVIAHARRRVLHFNVTTHPTSDWIVQQLREALPLPCPYRYIVFDRDGKFGSKVFEFLKACGIQPIRTTARSPWQNGIAERWVGSARREMLDYVIPLNEQHLRRRRNQAVTNAVASRGFRERPSSWKPDQGPLCGQWQGGRCRAGFRYHRGLCIPAQKPPSKSRKPSAETKQLPIAVIYADERQLKSARLGSLG